MTWQIAKCATCRTELNRTGECVACLLQIGLDEEAPPDQASEGPPTFGDFQIACRADGSLWELGRGGMGVTYRAVDHVLQRNVALKVIEAPSLLDQSAGMRERFLREARSAASLHHPNVAEVFQFGTSPETDRAYYAMKLIDGVTMEEHVRRVGPLPVETTLEVALQICRALVAAAGRGLVHRDLKPANVMLSFNGSGGTVLATVIDFGLARAMAEIQNETRQPGGSFVGTPAFASPEQLRGEPADARSDLYSLGVTLWYAVTGCVPFTGKTVAELRDHPARLALPIGQLTAKKVPAAMIGVLRAALAIDPGKRPTSAQNFLVLLEACTARRSHERRAALALAAVILAGLVAFWWAHRLPPSPGVPAQMRAPAGERSVAVLPFENFSVDKGSADFADGIQAEVIQDLSKVADLKVISRSSVMRYRDPGQRNLREIGPTLGVSRVVEGSVQRTGNKIRVTAELIDTRTDAHLWAEHYDRKLTDIFAIQSEIAEAVAGQLRAVIFPREQTAIDEVPTRDARAYELYLRALARWNDWDIPSPEDPVEAETMGLLQQATTRDPGFARAFAFMTQVQAKIYGKDPSPAKAEAVRRCAETVERLRPGSTDAYVAMGWYDDLVRRDFARAHDDFAVVVRLSPNDARAYDLLGLIERRGRWKEALAHVQKATELDPENNNYFGNYDDMLYALGRFQESLALSDRRIASHPSQYWLHANKVHTILAWKGDIQAARAEMAFMPPGFDPTGWMTYNRLECDLLDRDLVGAAQVLAACPLEDIYGTPREIYAGDIARRSGDAPAATAAYNAVRPKVEARLSERPDDTSPLFLLAKLDALLGRKEAALDEGRRMMTLATHNSLAIPSCTYDLAKVLVFAGETDQAITALQTICGKPYLTGDFVDGPQYGYLRLDPDWDPLRGDPRFEAMVTSLAPK